MEDNMNKNMKKQEILYLIADFSRGEHVLEEALQAGVDYIQLREKNISSAEYLRRAKRMKEMADAYHTPLIMNDRIDIALLVGAHGVHLGQDDVPVADARRVLGSNVLIGATAKTVEQAIEAQKQGADYIGSGAWFSTDTKKDAVPLARETYLQILENINIPNVAVGGLTIDNCQEPLSYGANGLAISAGILAVENIRDVIVRFKCQLKGKI